MQQQANSKIEKSVEVDVPARTAYNQWTQFEDFPLVFPGVDAVRQLDDRHLEFDATVQGRHRKWKLELCEQIPDKRIAWQALTEPWHAGVVTFHRLADARSKVMVQLEYRPEGLLPKVKDTLGLAGKELEQELLGFKRFLEARGKETGAWRGAVPSKDERAVRTAPAPGRAS